ncbi:hypothetical protein GCM10027359_07200 [Marilutibacter aestuarii]
MPRHGLGALALAFIVATIVPSCSEVEKHGNGTLAENAHQNDAGEPGAGMSRSVGLADQTPPPTFSGSSSADFDASGSRPVEHPYLNAESGLLVGDSISVESAGATLQTDRFDDVMEAMVRDTSRDTDAQDVTWLYRNAVDRALTSELSVSDFACGLSLCMGALRTRNPDAYARWYELFSGSSKAPTYSFLESQRNLGGEEVEFRFIFSTDPSADSVSSPAQ